MDNKLTLKMIGFLDLLMKVNVVLCIIGLIALKSGLFDRLADSKNVKQSRPVQMMEAATR
jgi:hypothetical protein